MSKLNAFLLAAGLMFIPGYASAEISLAEMLDVDTSLSVDVLNEQADVDLAQPVRHHGHTTVVRRTYRPAARPVVVHRTVVRRPVQPVVVVEQPATTVVVDNSNNDTPTPKKVGSTFGVGIRGVGLTQTPANFLAGGELKSKVAGGLGYYFKFRPVRWVSIEFINDILFGSFDNVDYYKNYIRVPVVAGLRAHVFDYGSLDVYGVAAASVTFVTIDDGDKTIDQEIRYPQFGGQFGAGISLIAGAFEIGLDLRYTIEEAPDTYRGIANPEIDQDKPVHGFLFSLNIGLAM